MSGLFDKEIVKGFYFLIVVGCRLSIEGLNLDVVDIEVMLCGIIVDV